MTAQDYISYFRSLIERDPSVPHWNDWWEIHKDDMVKLVSHGMFLRLTAPNEHTKILAIYAILREAGFDYPPAEQYDMHPKFWGPKPVPVAWLRKKISFQDLETEVGRSTRETPHFQIIKDLFRPGDEVWTFSSPPSTWKGLMGRHGFAFVRDGVPYEHIVTMMS